MRSKHLAYIRVEIFHELSVVTNTVSPGPEYRSGVEKTKSSLEYVRKLLERSRSDRRRRVKPSECASVRNETLYHPPEMMGKSTTGSFET